MFCYHVKISRFGMGDQEPKKIAEVTLLDEKNRTGSAWTRSCITQCRHSWR